MFVFEKFPVYQLAEKLSRQIEDCVFNNPDIDFNIKNQLSRALTSITSNIAEGSGKFTGKDKKNFYIIARGSTHECVSLVKTLYNQKFINKEIYTSIYIDFETISKMLTGLIGAMMSR
ncbi:MAG: hypothetical protein A2V81_04805 [Candidatus Abawacabacteria bacterium RBG_16_42_10]|uniref:Four helix bundle protein n=1 Tax=Candidatus Abawacabacteria bacterium RBG_16_42_10 TaxID=1817814 RepID=A0A1F4XJ16_9BACT|nr:MAG: hypothetical protein A2V81_04805 [Candidatus Abawacabacteria bacterium RBG_16_42_10]